MASQERVQGPPWAPRFPRPVASPLPRVKPGSVTEESDQFLVHVMSPVVDFGMCSGKTASLGGAGSWGPQNSGLGL